MSEAPEIEWTIPESWAWSRMGEIASVIGGGTPRTDDPSNYEGGEIAWITPADLSGYTHKYIQRGARNITQHGLENSGARTMPAGTVLFSSRAPIGYVAIAANPVSTNQGFKSFVLPEDLSPDYIYYYLQRAKEIARGLASGTTFLEISGAKATIIPVPVAPRPEQDRIVAEIEKQFTRLDDAVAALKRVQANLKRYRASVLKAACEGRLVPTEAELARKESRSYEPASELLKRILAERRATWEADQLQKMLAAGKPPKNDDWKKNYAEAIAPRVSNLPELPEGWSWASLDQLTMDAMIGLDRGREKQHAEPIGSPYVKMNNVSMQGEVDFTNLVYVQASSDEVEKFNLEHGDLLFNTRNSIELVGKVGIVSSPPPNSVFNNNLMRIRLSSAIDHRFVCDQMTSEVFRKQMELVKRSTTNVAAVYAKDLFPLAIAVPPAREQTRIAEAISKQTSILRQLIIDCEKLGRRSGAMRQAVLKEAFSGKLIPQDPNDEPASVLLERIRAERTALATNNGNQKATQEAGTANGQRRRRITRLAHRVSGGKGA